VFHTSIWEGWSFVWGLGTLKPGCGDETDPNIAWIAKKCAYKITVLR